MRKKLLMLVFVILAVLAAGMTVYASDYRRVTNISIRVDNVEDAVGALRGLAGQNLSSDVAISQRYGASFAHIERAVPRALHGAVLDALREFGDVTHESEFTVYYGSQMRELSIRLDAANNEIQRLLELLAGASSLDVLIAVDESLSRAERERNALQGQLNVLNASALQPIIVISMSETMPAMARFTDAQPYTLGERMANSFAGSWNMIIAGLGHFVVFLSLAIIPLGILGGLGLVVWLILRKKPVKSEESELS
ncbi:MAG: DUF4349 domain-containing protein [Defluviitaleaceae bacterium]|nr:DUF4349 domain-containing protein [Defluviitaleaceae bacterium]